MKITTEEFLWGNLHVYRAEPRVDGFYGLDGDHVDSSDIKSLDEYTDLIKNLIEWYGWDDESDKTAEFCSGKRLQKFRMPAKALIAIYYQKLLVSRRNKSVFLGLK